MEPERHGRAAYSQEGEDLVVARLLGLELSKRKGFYVDVGAHHPTKYSNTQYFYERGWSGINIDAMPGSMHSFRECRPRDINLEVAIAAQESELTFYQFATPELNGFDKDLAMERANVPGCKMTGTTVIPARPLSAILAEHLPAGTAIDFISVDVEGFDLEVLRSNDWNKFRPLLALVEDSESSTLQDSGHSPTAKYLDEVGYTSVARTALTTIVADRSRIVRGPFGVRIE
jgi:FkbM family methyltransferase